MEPPVAGVSMLALRHTAGALWIETCAQLPSLVAQLVIRVRVTEMAVVLGDEKTIPTAALVAADVILSTLAAAYSWEWRPAHPSESWHLKHLPPCILQPWREVCKRLGMPGVGLSFTALVGGRYSVIDPTAWSHEEPYPERLENIAIVPAVFGSREEHVFLGVIVESLAIFKSGLRAMVAAQQAVMDDDAQQCFVALREVKVCVDRLVHAFHKISPNAANGSHYVDPIIWGKTVAPLNSPINPEINSPGGSGLYVPLFHALDAFLGRTKFDSALGVEALHLRKWFPPNWRKLISALGESTLSVRAYAMKVESQRRAADASGQHCALPPLRRIYEQTLEAYAGERGWMGTHRFKGAAAGLDVGTSGLCLLPTDALPLTNPHVPKSVPVRVVFGFLQLVFKSGRTSTNGGTMDDAEQPWESVHAELQRSREERLQGKRAQHCRGGAAECPFRARVLEAAPICADTGLRTAKVTLSLPDGLDWTPGDRLMVLPPNPDADVEDLLAAIRRDGDENIGLDATWAAFFEHADTVLWGACVASIFERALREIVRYSVLRPLGWEEALALRAAIPNTSTAGAPDVLDALLQEPPSWPAPLTLAGMLRECFGDEPLALSDGALCTLLRPQKLRCYSISNAPAVRPQTIGIAHPVAAPVEARVELTVTRQDFTAEHSEGVGGGSATKWSMPGVSSGFLNPSVKSQPPVSAANAGMETTRPCPCALGRGSEGAMVMVGVQPPLQFSLPSAMRPIVLLAAGSGVAPFRAFLQMREAQARELEFQSENWLLFGCRDEGSLLYRSDWDGILQRGALQFKPYVALSRERTRRVEFGPTGLSVVLGASRGRYVADMLSNDRALANSLIEILVPMRMGGRGGSFFICGSVPFFQGLMRSLRSELTRYGSDGAALLEEAFSERRLCIEVFSSPKRLAPSSTGSGAGQRSEVQVEVSTREAPREDNCSNRLIWQSEMCRYAVSGMQGGVTSAGAGATTPLWFAVHGTVFDVRSFVDTHPGGGRIVADVSGMDATRAFQLVAHDVNPEVMGRMASHRVGTLREVSSHALERTSLHKACVASGRPWHIPELCDLARKAVYTWVELENCFGNDLNSIADMRRSVQSQVSWVRGMSMQEVRPLITFCARVIQLLEPGGICMQTCAMAERARGLVRKSLGLCLKDTAPAQIPTAHQYGWANDLRDVSEYVSTMRALSYTLEGTTSVAEQMAMQSRIDMEAVHGNLLVCARAGVTTIGAIKAELLAALRGLERLLREAESTTTPPTEDLEDELAVNGGGGSEGCISRGKIAQWLQGWVGLPAALERLIGRGFCSVVVAQFDPVLASWAIAPETHSGGQRAATLTQLRELHRERTGGHGNSGALPAFVGDEMLQEEVRKIENWMVFGQVRAVVAAQTIALKWRRRKHASTRHALATSTSSSSCEGGLVRRRSMSERTYDRIKSYLWRVESH